MDQPTVEELLIQGAAARSDARWADADAALRGALAAATTPVQRAATLEALVELGLDTGDDLAAETWLTEAQALFTEAEGPMSPAVGRCWMLQARLSMLSTGDLRRASDAWERAVRLLDGEARRQAWHGLGRSRLEQGEDEAAERSLLLALDGAQGWLRAEVLESLARLRTLQGQHQRALLHVHERVGLVHELRGPWTLESANTLLLLAGTCEAADDLEAAVSAMDRAVQTLGRVLEQDDPETMMAAAYLLALRSRLAGAPALPEDPAGEE